MEHDAKAINGRLHYEGWGIDSRAATIVAAIAYLYLVIVSTVLSSLPYSTVFGELGFASLVVTFILWKYQYPSTWCFFAAILSSIVILVVWCELQLYLEPQEDGTSKERSSKERSLSQAEEGVATTERRSRHSVETVKENRTSSKDSEDLL